MDDILTDTAVQIVRDYAEKHMPDSFACPGFGVLVVWQCYLLGNVKWFLTTTTRADGMYYEVTFNGDKNEFYLDAYRKVQNCCIKLDSLSRGKNLVHGSEGL